MVVSSVASAGTHSPASTAAMNARSCSERAQHSGDFLAAGEQRPDVLEQLGGGVSYEHFAAVNHEHWAGFAPFPASAEHNEQ